MKRVRTSAFYVALALGTAFPLLAQELPKKLERVEEKTERELYWKWANFVILGCALGYFIHKKAGTYFRTRSEAIRSGIQEADRLRREAEQRVAEIEHRLKNLGAEVEALRTKAREEMSAENERLRQETREALDKIRRQAEQEIASAAKAAQHEVRAHAAELAVELAAGQIRAAMNPQTDAFLVASFLEGLQGRPGAEPIREVN